MTLLKDEVLNDLATRANVASFVSFSAGEPKVRFARVPGVNGESSSIDRGTSVREAVVRLMSAVGTSVNVRSFRPDGASQGLPFHYGLHDVSTVVEHINHLSNQGLLTLVNETVDINDGGVSGVIESGVVEFAPDDTPRAVERTGVASLPADLAATLIHRIYEAELPLDLAHERRVEFSAHPHPVGFRQTNMLVWEASPSPTSSALQPRIAWPNSFSRLLGDKAYGLLLADLLGARVPRTTVVSRRVRPFTFGTAIPGSGSWTRTAPPEPRPGLLTTVRGWTDVFHLVQLEDPTEADIASVLSQDAVPAKWSGASAWTEEGPLVEGVEGAGDQFMLGQAAPTPLPERVARDVSSTVCRLAEVLGPTRIEWVHDGTAPWVVQLHLAQTQSTTAIVEGEAEKWLRFNPDEGLEKLRHLAAEANERGCGILVTKPIGVTSHIGDVLRRSGVPSRLQDSRE